MSLNGERLDSAVKLALSDVLQKIRAIAGAGGRGRHSMGGAQFVDPNEALGVIYALADAAHNLPAFLNVSGTYGGNTEFQESMLKKGLEDVQNVNEKLQKDS